MKTFGEYIKNLRIQKELTLREFCRKVDLDPSNWSKTERGINPPPKSQYVLNTIAEILGLNLNSEEYKTLIDLAAISHIPTELISDNDILEKLPVFFRTVRGEAPTKKELDDLINLIKKG